MHAAVKGFFNGVGVNWNSLSSLQLKFSSSQASWI